MTYFADLSPYSYTDMREGGSELLCVGWLDKLHPFPVGPTPASFHAALLDLCANDRSAQTRGSHRCQFSPCDQLPTWPPMSAEGPDGTVDFGSAEIRVVATGNVCLTAPTLIYHYVVTHGYRPPDDFIEAVQNRP